MEKTTSFASFVNLSISGFLPNVKKVLPCCTRTGRVWLKQKLHFQVSRNCKITVQAYPFFLKNLLGITVFAKFLPESSNNFCFHEITVIPSIKLINLFLQKCKSLRNKKQKFSVMQIFCKPRFIYK